MPHKPGYNLKLQLSDIKSLLKRKAQIDLKIQDLIGQADFMLHMRIAPCGKRAGVLIDPDSQQAFANFAIPASVEANT